MRIAVVGGGFANKGAEAMLRTVQLQLGSRIPDAEIVHWRSIRSEESLAWASGLTPASLMASSSRLRKVHEVGVETLRSVQDIRGIPMESLRAVIGGRHEVRKLLNLHGSVNAVIDVSGYAYGDTWGTRPLILARALLELMGPSQKVKYVFMPQAWGPFHREDVRRHAQALVLDPRVRLYARDAVSCLHLAQLTGSEADTPLPRPDIAFAFKGQGSSVGSDLLRGMGCTGTRRRVGISPNMRVFERSSGHAGENRYITGLVKLARWLIRELDVDVVLQANETFVSGQSADDRYLCSLIWSAVGIPDRCFFDRRYFSAELTKSVISSLDYLVGSRFHSLVFALGSGVPCAAIGWSHKYQELMEAFGRADAVVGVDALHDGSAAEFIRAEFPVLEEVRQHEESTSETMRVDVNALFDEVSVLLSEIGQS